MLKFVVVCFVLLFSHQLLASIDCSSLWANGFPEAGHRDSAGDCYPFEPLYTTLTSGQEMYFKNTSISDEVAKQYMEWAAEAFSYASTKYNAFASVPKIRMVYSDVAYPGTSDQVTPAVTYVDFFQLGLEFCPIVLYPAVTLFSKEHFQQIVAHEVYHCVQKVAFPDVISSVVQQTSEGMFWFESVAQFMSNDVYPRNDFEYHSMFGVFDQQLPFFEQASPYLSEFFFQGLFWEYGARSSAVHATQSVFRGSGSTAIDNALAIPEISTHFHKIARDLSFDKLLDSSEEKVPFSIEKQIFVVPEESTSSISISFMDFAIAPFEITFPKKGQYRLNIRRVDGAKLSVRKVGSEDWSDDFETSFITECDSERKLEGIYTKVSADLAMNAIQIDIERTENETCPCDIEERPTDTCLFGEWEADNSTIMAFMRRLVGGAININNVTGSVILKFDPEGQHSWNYHNLMVQGEAAGRRPVIIQMFWNGANTLKYSDFVSGTQKRVCSRMVNMGVTAHATTTVAGRTFDIPAPVNPVSGEGSMGYSCNDTTFTYDINTGPTPLNWIFHRVR